MKHSKSIQTAKRIGLGGAIVSALAVPILANGNETLGNPADGGPPGPALAIADGTQVIMNGIGLFDEQPGSFFIDIPAGVTVQQVIAYWEGMSQTPDQQGPTDTIQVNGGDVTGDRIGGPNFFFSAAYTMTYRASLPNDFVTVGDSTMVTVSGLDFDRTNDGFGILVIVDDGISATEIGVRDGNDTAFINFAAPRDTTVPQVFNFAPTGADRTATFGHFFSSVAPNRPSIITIDIPGFPQQTLDNAIGDSNGPEWDTLMHDVMIPAGSSQVTIQALSADCCDSGILPASFIWVGTGFFFPEACTGRVGDFVWLDENRDGCQDVDEPGVPEIVLNLYRKNADGSTDFLDTTVTDADGAYFFEGLCAGDYLIEIEAVPDGLSETVPDACGGDDTRDSDCIDGVMCVTLPTDFAEDLTIDCGLAPPCSGEIGDLVWLDANRDGCQDADEVGVPGVVVNLSADCDGTPELIATTVTDANGVYGFEGLCAGDYLVEFESIPDGLSETEPNACGGDDTRDSDCVDGSVCVTLPTDFTVDLTIDCGLVPPDGGGEGCTPGFWKNRGRRIDAWEYPTGANFDIVFGTDVFGTSTLLEVIRNRPDVVVPHDLYKALGRHAVAALLNAASADVDYDLTEAEVINLVAGAYATGDLGIIESVKDSLDAFNNQHSDICQ